MRTIVRELLQTYNSGYIQKETGIAVPSIRRLQEGKAIRLSPSSLKALYNAAKRAAYRQVKNAGITDWKEARNVATLPRMKRVEYVQLRNLNVLPDDARIAIQQQKRVRENFLKLRRNGARQDFAEVYAKAEKTKVNEIAAKYRQYAKILAKGNNVKLSHILRGMRFSDKLPQQWEEYIKVRQKQGWYPVKYNYKTRNYEKVVPNSALYQRWKDSGNG